MFVCSVFPLVQCPCSVSDMKPDPSGWCVHICVWDEVLDNIDIMSMFMSMFNPSMDETRLYTLVYILPESGVGSGRPGIVWIAVQR